MKHQPDLGIENPYALDEKQFAAAVDLLKKQRKNIGEYWSDYLKAISAFETGDLRDRHHVAGHRQLDRPEEGERQGDPPGGGATGWSDTWMISSKAKSPNCAYAWLNYIDSPEGQRAGDRVLR